MRHATMIHPVAEQGFGSDPERYERGRPGYPPEAIDAIMEFARLQPSDRMLDLAAGTGKLTRLLPETCAKVAVEPVQAMRRFLSSRLRNVAVVGGIAEALPFSDETFRLVTAAQAFHWFDTEKTWPELARVVPAGGTVALVWNARDRSVDWVDRIWAIMDRVEKRAPWRDHDRAQRFDTGGSFAAPIELVFRHHATVSESALIDRVTSVSHVAVLPDDERMAIAEEIRTTLRSHPDTTGRQAHRIPYRTDLFLFRRR